MLESVSVSGLIESMRYNGGHSTKQSSTVTMAVTHKFATEVANLIEDYQKKGIEPEEGLIRLELIAHYDDGEEATFQIESGIPSTEGEGVKITVNDDLTELSDAGEQIIDDLTETVDEVLDGEGVDAEEGFGD